MGRGTRCLGAGHHLVRGNQLGLVGCCVYRGIDARVVAQESWLVGVAPWISNRLEVLSTLHTWPAVLTLPAIWAAPRLLEVVSDDDGCLAGCQCSDHLAQL